METKTESFIKSLTWEILSGLLLTYVITKNWMVSWTVFALKVIALYIYNRIWAVWRNKK